MKLLTLALLFCSTSYAQVLKYVKPNNITNLHKGMKEIVLTIDDGPSRNTIALLDILSIQGVQGTFFVTGRNMRRYPQVMNQIVREGHIVANHTESHLDLRKQSASRIKKEVDTMYQTSFPYFSNGDYLYFRSPYGAWDRRVSQIINQTEYAEDMRGPIFWDIGGTLTIRGGRVVKSADWNCWSKGLSVNRCLEGYVNETLNHKGGVVLFHEIKANSVKLIEKYIIEMRKRGYNFVSMDAVKL